MRTSPVTPNGTERTFGDDEIIVSKTDAAGRITYVNEVFTRVSAYHEQDLLGKPHNIIRHPDMPRCIFKLLWDTVKNGDEIFAYVLNLAGDGAHYWVLAHVTPSHAPTGQLIGYHSNRRTAHRQALAQVKPLYQQLLAEERRHSRSDDALAASMTALDAVVASRAAGYDEFVWSLEPEAIRL